MVPFSRLIVLGAALVLAQAAAPQPPPPQQPPPRFRTETNLVRVDVYATKDGVALQDLTAADFEVYEDNTPQKIDSFEHIIIRPAGPQEPVIDPSPSAAIQLAADPRRRVFVIYLDHNHVGVQGSHAIKEPLIDLMQRVMSDDDLIGVMTPDMSPSHIAFGRRTRVIEDALRKNWAWGRRGTVYPEDDREKMYDICFSPGPGERGPLSALARALIIRRRERIVLDSLQDLTRYMAAVREGRTAVITVSDGWLLFRPDRSLTNPRSNDPIPGGPPPVGVGPGGTLTKRIGRDMQLTDRTECEKDRMALAMADNERQFRDILGEANRANVSFYTIDPRGLSTYDEPPGLDSLVLPEADRRNLISRQDSLMTLAGNTDGLALVNNNDLRKQLRRVADDLTSYYLLGYYSTNSKLDGKFRTIKVRSKRPGVEIRSRRGYNTATAAEVAAARAASDVAVPEAKAAVIRPSVRSRATRARRGARRRGPPAIR